MTLLSGLGVKPTALGANLARGSRPLAEALRRCDALAVAVGLIDRKHVGVVGANRDAAAAKGVPAPRPHMSTFKSTRLFVSAAAADDDDDDDDAALSVFSFKDPFEAKGEPVDAVADRAVPLYCV